MKEILQYYHDVVFACIKESLDLDIFSLTQENSGKAICLKNKHQLIDDTTETFAWIRITAFNTNMEARAPRHKDFHCIVDFSSITLCEAERGKGHFLKMYQALCSSDDVHEIRVSGVSTSEIVEWCKKRNMKYSAETLTYLFKKAGERNRVPGKA